MRRSRRCSCSPRRSHGLSGAELGRGWTWIDEDKDTPEDSEEADLAMDRKTEILNMLAKEWTHLHEKIEREVFIRQARVEEGYDEPEFESEAEEAVYNARRDLYEEARQARLDIIENKMAELGARIMRPYEHWNEDERWMEWSERDR